MKHFLQDGVRLPALLCALSIWLTGCTFASSSGATRLSETGIGPDERISVIVVIRQGDSGPAPWQDGGCIENWMRSAHREFKFVPPEEFVKIAFPDQSPAAVAEALKSSDLLEQLLEPGRASRIRSLKLRYLVVGRYETAVTDEHLTGDIGEGVAAIGKESTRVSRFEAEVIDFAKGVRAGTVTSQATGEQGGGVLLVMYVIPVPMFWSTPTETTACSKIGKALADFILQSNAEPNS